MTLPFYSLDSDFLAMIEPYHRSAKSAKYGVDIDR